MVGFNFIIVFHLNSVFLVLYSCMCYKVSFKIDSFNLKMRGSILNKTKLVVEGVRL